MKGATDRESAVIVINAPNVVQERNGRIEEMRASLPKNGALTTSPRNSTSAFRRSQITCGMFLYFICSHDIWYALQLRSKM